MDSLNLLLGNGHKLSHAIDHPKRSFTPKNPYTLAEHVPRLATELARQDSAFRAIRSSARPDGNLVSKMTLHPQFYSRSFFPARILRDFDFRLIGSKPTRIRPLAGRGAEDEFGAETTALFVAGTASAFEAFTNSLGDADAKIGEELLRIEEVSPLLAPERVIAQIPHARSALEVIVHFDPELDLDWEEQFVDFARESGVDLNVAQSFQSRGLWFIPANSDSGSVERFADYTFVRAIRPLPRIRILEAPKVTRARAAPSSISLPSESAVDPDCRIAIFDGGLLPNVPFARWTNAIEPPASASIGNPVSHFLEHGTAVTSAALFGHVDSGQQHRPFASVDHYRVLGDALTDSSIYPVMLYIDSVLSQSRYEFISLSVGPDEIIGNDVTAWTAMLDEHLGDGPNRFCAIAVGNNGAGVGEDARVMVPSDCVNGIAVGATTCVEDNWRRADYSARGPGRQPGLVKPDLVHFGGCDGNEFGFVFPGPAVAMDQGTSYATPSVVRIATGVRAHFGSAIAPLAIRALMIHSANHGGLPREEVGWGRVSDDVAALVACGNGAVRVLYQGTLQPQKLIRAPIPLPSTSLSGRVTVKATCVYVCGTDPHTPGDYTRGGLLVRFRPHAEKFEKSPAFPKTRAFFVQDDLAKEQDLRGDGHKWDTVLHHEELMLGSSLLRPVFDIHCMAREPGNPSSPTHAQKIHYALVVTVTAPKIPDLYQQVATTYANVLAPIQPRVQLPIRIEI